jgi:hypothetical protein
MNDEIGAIQRRREEPLVALEFQRIRHDAVGIGQHAIGRNNDIALDVMRWHGCAKSPSDYCETSVTTLETGRELTVGSLISLSMAWS